MEQLTEWTPAFDKRHKDPMKNYGIGSIPISEKKKLLPIRLIR